MTRSFPRLSSPFAIGKLTIKNRFAVALGEEATPTKVAECQFGTYAARAVRATQWPSSPALAGGATPRRLCGRFAMLPIVPAPLV